MGVYKTLQAGGVPSAGDIAGFAATLGGKVMARATVGRWTTAANMEQITDAFYRELRAANWRWTPSTSCGNLVAAANMLDGTMMPAECKLPANAFSMLLNAPAPYGFGEASKVVSYSGKELLIGANNGQPTARDVKRTDEKGFYARHGVEHHLAANVWDAASGAMSDLYRWDNHKVVELNNRYWDVCYNRGYTFLTEMAVAIFIGTNEVKTKTKTIQESMALIHEDKVVISKHLQIAYFRIAPPGSIANQAGAAVEGPYADSLYGDESAYGPPVGILQW